MDVLAPSDVPEEITLTLQVRTDESGFSNYASGIVAGDRVWLGFDSCAWLGLRWKTEQAS